MNSQLGTVYLVQNPPPTYRGDRVITRDLSSAQRYGRLFPILTQQEQASLTPGPCTHKLARALREFDPTKDYICFAGGDPMALALSLLILRDMNLREVKTLRWERERDTNGDRMLKGGYYVPVSVNLYI